MTDALVEQLQSLLPPVSYDPKGEVLGAQLSAEAGALGAAIAGIESVEAAIFPLTAGKFIADWERVYNLTPAPGATQDERVDSVIAALSDLGGQSIPYFKRLASLFGVTSSVEVFRVPVVGLLNAGDPIYSGDWPFIWRMNLPLSAYSSTAMEARITERRPANTEVVFGYGADVIDKLLRAADEIYATANYEIPSKMSVKND